MRGNRLQALRESRGMSQTELARHIGVHQQQISKYENDEAIPTVEILTKLAQIFKITTDYLLGLTDNPTGEISEDDLTPLERKLIFAVRSGALLEALKSITDIQDRAQNTDITCT